MDRYYKLAGNKIIDIDKIDLIDYDESTNKYIICIGNHTVFDVNGVDVYAIIDKLDIINYK
jgi:hypothetical protein